MKKILIIEDEQTVRESLKELLMPNGYKVFSASDGIEGIQLAQEIIPDLIICDVMMPKLNGYGVIEELKKEFKLTTVPFIFLTAKAEMSDLRNGMEQGADDYITKPFKSSTILKAIETRLKKYESIKNQNDFTEISPDSKENKVLKEEDRFFIKVNGRPEVIKVGDIVWIKAEAEYTKLLLINGQKILVRKLLKQWEAQLPGSIFLRIHRSTIVNINTIEKIEKWHSRSYILLLKNHTEKFIISQRYAGRIRNKFLM